MLRGAGLDACDVLQVQPAHLADDVVGVGIAVAKFACVLKHQTPGVSHVLRLRQGHSQGKHLTPCKLHWRELNLAQAAIEQSYDKDGIIWPVAIAPYQALVVIPNIGDAEQVKVAVELYQSLNLAGIETLLDDRDERAGVKFKDGDLIGIPYRIVTGRSLKEGKVEVVQRATKQSQELPITEVVSTLRDWIG